MAQPTVFSVAGVSISANGGHSGNALFSLENQLLAASQAGTLTVYTPTLPAASTVQGQTGSSSNPIQIAPPAPSASGNLQVLVLPATATGFISIPSGYGDIVYNGPGTLIVGGKTIAGSNGSVVVGDLNVKGGAASVVAGGTGGNVSDSTSGALLDFVSGNYVVHTYLKDTTSGNLISGANQSLQFANRAGATLIDTGANTMIQIGDPGAATIAGTTDTVRASAQYAVTISGASDSVNYWPEWAANFDVTSTASNTVFNFTGTTSQAFNSLSIGDAATINATNGAFAIFTTTGSEVNMNATGDTSTNYVLDGVGNGSYTTGSHTFVEVSGDTSGVADTITGSAASNDSVFAFAGVDVNDAAAQSTFFLGSTTPGVGASTIHAGASAQIFAGAAGGTYVIGTSSFFLGYVNFPSGSTSNNTVVQTSLSATGFNALMYTTSNENLTLTTVGGSFKAGSTGDAIFMAGSNTEVNVSNSGGSNILMMDNALAGGSAVTGTSTLVGSSAGHDQMFMFFDSSSAPAHTVTIENYQASDSFTVGFFGSGSVSATDQQTIADFNAGVTTDPNVTASSFTLTDGTTVSFSGTVPHNVIIH